MQSLYLHYASTDVIHLVYNYVLPLKKIIYTHIRHSFPPEVKFWVRCLFIFFQKTITDNKHSSPLVVTWLVVHQKNGR